MDWSPDLSSFLLDLDLDSDLRRFATKSAFNFHICSVLLRPYILPTRIVRTTKNFVTYLIFTAESTRGLAFYDSISFLLLRHTAINNLDSESRSFRGLGLEASELELEASGLDLKLVNLNLRLVDLT